MFKKAFTLAEVLVTLGIIGVVAAITLPVLIQKHNEKVLLTSFKRVYSTLQQAYTFAQNEYGTYENWQQTSSDDYNKLKPYFKILRDCPTLNNKCFPDIKYKFYNNDEQTYNINNINRNDQAAIRLQSGEAIRFARTVDQANFVVDLNGNRGPNKYGVDVHFFSFNNARNSKSIMPGPTWNNNHPKYCKKNAITGNGANETVGTPGSGCGWWIVKHGNMDYLHMSDSEVQEKW